MSEPDTPNGPSSAWNRRSLLKALAAAGIGSAVFQRALAAQAEERKKISAEMIKQAEWIAGLELTDQQREDAARALQTVQDQLQAMRSAKIEFDVPPAVHFFVEAPHPISAAASQKVVELEQVTAERPRDDDELAWATIPTLASLLRRRKISAVELTKLYLARLEKFDPLLHCVVTMTGDLALRQAAQADKELAAGRDRGPLHGIPWGAKDLIAYPGFPTTWGAGHFREQHIESKATVAERLDQSGAILLAKLTLGAIAWGDQWFGGMTRNPWHPEEGSSGSSAGSAAAAAAGLAGFTIGSETLGSIVSPCRRCGATGLRPTFGRISRHGCMPLSWSMDKLGPIARSAEDCAIVFATIHGTDGLDPTVVDRPFEWPPKRDVRSLRVGFFEEQQDSDGSYQRALDVLRELGVRLTAVRLPDDLPHDAMSLILSIEAATVFDELTREGVTEGMNRWPPIFRRAEFIPAVEYLRANRLRTMLMRKMSQLMDGVDAYVGGDDLTITNLTGHPTVVMPSGFSEKDGVRRPSSVTMTGRLFGESELLGLAHAFQQATGFHRERPPLAI